MTAFILRRLVLMVVTMAVSSFLVFMAVEFSPTSVARKMLGQWATEDQVALLTRQLKLDDPVIVRYGRWLKVVLGLSLDPMADPKLLEEEEEEIDSAKVKTGPLEPRLARFEDHRGHQYFGNFSYSHFYRVAVNDIIWDRLANTGKLAGIAFAIFVPLGVLFGVIMGVREGSKTDRSLSFFSILFSSIPEFASAVFIIILFVAWLELLPGTSTMDPAMGPVYQQFIMPVLVLVIYSFGYIARMMRTSMAEVMREPYVRTAVLKGVQRQRVIYRHALRNAMIAPFTVILLSFNFLITGVVVTEVIFGYPGFGRLFLEAALFGDVAVLEAATMITVFIAVMTQLIGDLGYMALNPRVRVS